MMTRSSRLWHGKHTAEIGLPLVLYNKDVQKKKCNVLHPLRPPTPLPLFLPPSKMYSLIPSCRLVNRNGSSAKLCTMGISTFLFSLKITACCSILCYGRCVPMGWLAEQRMGESKPACSSKQVLHAFEDAHLLQAKVGLEEEMCALSDMRAFIHSSARGDIWPVWSPTCCPVPRACN